MNIHSFILKKSKFPDIKIVYNLCNTGFKIFIFFLILLISFMFDRYFSFLSGI